MNRATFLLALLAVEVLAVSLSFDALPQAGTVGPDDWTAYVAYAGHVARFLSVAIVALLVLAAPRLPVYLSTITAAGEGARRPGSLVPLLGLQVTSALAFFIVSAFLFSAPSAIADSSRPTFIILWLATGTLLAGTWGLALAPLEFWRNLLRKERLTILLAGVAGLAAVVVASWAQHLWGGLAHVALTLAHACLLMFYDEVFLDPEALRLGVEGFIVTVGYPCSGYEGIGLISLFTGLYLYVFRREFRFPQALLLFPIGIATIWVFNVARIALLIAIGAELSPEVALGGFHSQAGWISFLLVSVGILQLAHRSGFSKEVEDGGTPSRSSEDTDLAVATLLPLVIVLAVTLIAGVMATEGDIPWLYPLKTAAGAAAIAYCWKTLALPAPRFDGTAVLVGAGVFVVWIMLAPMNAAYEPAATIMRLETLSPWLWLWIVVRFLGAAAVVPMVEELAFRGYLLCRLSRREIALTGRLGYRWIAILGSSVLFGLLHEAWLAGIASGIVYALLRVRSESIWTPMVAHGVTNALLFIYMVAMAG